MNRRQIINKILHNHIDVNRHEDYTNYKKLITAIEEWHESEVKKLPIYNVVRQSEQLSVAWKALEWVGFTKGEEFTDDDIQEMLNA